MKVTLNTHTLIAEREESEKIYSESLLLHKIKVALIEQGHDVIKKRMWKDGHMVGGDDMQYIRSRKGDWCVYDTQYALRLSTEPYNKPGGSVMLTVAHLN